jgi:hypothetical protein
MHNNESVQKCSSSDAPENHLTGATTGSSINTRDTRRSSSTLSEARRDLGLHPHAPIDEDHEFAERQKLLWSRIRVVLREPFAECLGVVIMVMFGDGSVAQVLLSTNETMAPGGSGFGTYQSINWG